MLGIKYAWIDSLCIIQDMADDWKKESLKIGAYFQNCEFTVVAMNIFPADGLEISQRSLPLESLPMAKLPYRDAQGQQNGHFYVYPRNSASFLDDYYRRYISSGEILERGWVFQEWILSRRIVCFTPSGLYLQCRCPDESPVNQHGEALSRDLTKRSNIELSVKASLGLEFNNTEAIYSAWEEIVEQYCKLKLSQPQDDRIIALSGVAVEFQKALRVEDSCVAGLWRRDLHHDLLWERVRPGSSRRFDNFPTWSWASIDAPVRWPCRQRKAKTHPLTMHPSGTLFWTRDSRTPRCDFTGTARISSQSLDFFLQQEDTSEAAVVIPATIEDGARRCLPAPVERSLPDRRHVEDNFVLHVCGRLQPVLIGNYFPDDASFCLAVDVIGYPAKNLASTK